MLMSRPPLMAAAVRRPSAPATAALTLALALLLAIPMAAAHGAPSAKDQDTRLLADHNDDCGGDDPGSLSNCRDTHDLIALDVRERNDGGQDVVVFRLFLNGGKASDGLRDVLTLKADGAMKAFELRTTNNQDFQNTGADKFDSVSKAISINDGTRFVVEASVRRDSLGPVDGKLTDFKVDAFRGSTSGDYMPGGYQSAIGPVADPQQSPATNRIAGCLKPGTQQVEQSHCYRLRGPGYYIGADDPGAQSVEAGSETIVQVSLHNQLRSTPQSLTLTVTGADGVRARFHDPNAASGEGYSDTMRIDLPGGGSTSTHVALDQGEDGASGTLTVTVTTDLGGLTQVQVPYSVVAGAAPADASPTGGSEDDSKGLPGPAPLVLALGLVAAALAARRRA
ncbi:MAG: hypothetical protein QOC71_498 [Thermoplasmata archaeon]|jgi:hypothetical protein|nr:hypothetical protein [Thermoplasmata archaeon]